jgi:hypothetical protein
MMLRKRCREWMESMFNLDIYKTTSIDESTILGALIILVLEYHLHVNVPLVVVEVVDHLIMEVTGLHVETVIHHDIDVVIHLDHRMIGKFENILQNKKKLKFCTKMK